MDIDKLRALLDKRDAVDREIIELVLAGKKQVTCSLCQQQGHTARSCKQRSVT